MSPVISSEVTEAQRITAIFEGLGIYRLAAHFNARGSEEVAEFLRLARAFPGRDRRAVHSVHRGGGLRLRFNLRRVMLLQPVHDVPDEPADDPECTAIFIRDANSPVLTRPGPKGGNGAKSEASGSMKN
jgi:hypothetical protein